MTEPSPSLLSAEVTGVNELPCSAAWFFSLELEIIFQATPGTHQTHSVWRLFVLMLRGCYVSGAWSMHFLWKAKMVNYVDGRTLWWSLLCCCGMGANMAVTVMGVAMFQLLGQSQLVCWHLILCVCFLFFFSLTFIICVVCLWSLRPGLYRECLYLPSHLAGLQFFSSLLNHWNPP